MATPARRGFQFPFDPVNALGWAIPLILVAPLLAFVLLAFAAPRTRRSAANLALSGFLVSLAATGLVSWARLPRAGIHKESYQWLNLPIAVSGQTAFQNFTVDIELRIDHASLVAIVVVLLLSLAVTTWSRAGTRGEPGVARTMGFYSLLTFAALGVVMSGDLVELLAFWSLGGVATYLVLAQRWGSEPVARASRVALAVPFLTDMCLLAGIGVLYSRYGQLELDRLLPALHETAGWGYKSLTAACILIFVGLAGRLALAPLLAWQTATAALPTGPAALVQGIWPLLAGIALYRLLPVFQGAGPQALAVLAIWSLAAALVAGLLALVGNEARQVATAAGTIPPALGLVAIAYGTASTGLMGIIAAAPARSALLLAVGGLVQAMRTADLGQMGAALRRMRVTAGAAGLAALGLAVGEAQPGALSFGQGWVRPWFAAALVLVALAAFRIFFGAGLGELRRRRAFDPERVRESPPAMSNTAFGLGVLAVLAATLTGSTRWLTLLDGRAHHHPALSATLAWLAAPALGLLLGFGLYVLAEQRGHRLSARLGEIAASVWLALAWFADRFLTRPALQLIELAETVVVARSGAGLGASLTNLGQLLSRGSPALPVFFATLLAVAVLVGLLTPGLAR